MRRTLWLLALVLTACGGDGGVPREPADAPEAGSSQDASSPEDRVLQPPASFVHELHGGAAESFSVELEAGSFVAAAAEQREIDVALTLVDPGGEEVVTVDSPTGKRGTEKLWAVAGSAGVYRLEVRAFGGAELVGSYRLDVAAPRRATEEDRLRAAAVVHTARAEGLRGRIDRGDPDSVVRTLAEYGRALELWRRLGDVEHEAAALFMSGEVRWFEKGDRDGARRDFEAALPLLLRIGDRVRAARLEHYLGGFAYRESRLGAARDHYLRAAELWPPGSAEAAATWNGLGLVHRLRGEAQKALDSYDRALERWTESGEREEQAKTLHNRGKLYLQVFAQQRRALDDLEAARAIWKELHNRKELALTLTAIGQAHRRVERLALAEQHFRSALAMHRELGDRRREGLVLIDLGRVERRAGRWAAAEKSFREALRLLREEGAAREQGHARRALGELHVELGRHGEARRELLEALEVFERIGYPSAVASLGHALAVLERREGRPEPALGYLKKALRVVEDLRAKPVHPELRAAYFADRSSYHQLEIDLLMELHEAAPEAGWATRALAASERARARALLDLLGESEAELTRGIAPELVARERHLAERIREIHFRRSWLLDERSPRPTLIESMDREVRRLLRDHEQAEARIRTASPEFAELSRPEPLEPDAIRRFVLDDETLLLVYDLGPEKSYLWLLSSGTLESFVLPAQARIEELARRAVELLTRRPRLDLEAAAALRTHRLSEAILGPAAGRLDRRRLLIVPDGILHYVPFAALPVPGGAVTSGDAAALLIDRHEVVYTPSASVLALLRRRAAGRGAADVRLALVADPVYPRGDERCPPGEDRRPYRRLPFSRSEAEAILALVPAERTFRALGFAASRELLVDADLRPYTILHFATHGDLDAENGRHSRLVLSLYDEDCRPRDGFLYAHEVYRMELPAELVVLSACRTGLGEEVLGEGLVGLTRGFLYAGSSRVVVSLWNVDDRATAELMRGFYRQMLRRDKAPAAALGEAQRSLRHQPGRAAPFYWAAFVLYGEWR